MSRFFGKLVLALLDDKERPATRDGRSLWGVEQPLTYQTSIGGLAKITVPAGFVTDLASIPRMASPVLPPDGPWTKAAVIHDALYYCRGGQNTWHGRRIISRARPYTRAEADDILREAMADRGVDTLRRNIIWAAVRAGGRRGWGT